MFPVSPENWDPVEHREDIINQKERDMPFININHKITYIGLIVEEY